MLRFLGDNMEKEDYFELIDEDAISSSLYGGSTLENFGTGKLYCSPIMQVMLMSKIVELISENDTVLDLGCGTADLAQICYVNRKHINYIGIEANAKTVKKALPIIKRLYNSKNWNARLIQRDLTKGIPLEDDTVDFVSCILVLEHLPKESGEFLLKEIQRVLKRGGEALLVTPNKISGKDKASYHIYEWEGKELQQKIIDINLNVLDMWFCGATMRQIKDSIEHTHLYMAYDFCMRLLPKMYVRLMFSQFANKGHDIAFLLEK